MDFAAKNSHEEKLKRARQIFLGALTEQDLDYTAPDLYLRILEERSDADLLELNKLIDYFKENDEVIGCAYGYYDLSIPYLIRLESKGLIQQTIMNYSGKLNFEPSFILKNFTDFIQPLE